VGGGEGQHPVDLPWKPPETIPLFGRVGGAVGGASATARAAACAAQGGRGQTATPPSAHHSA